MNPVTYSAIEQLASDLAGYPRDKLPTSDATMLRAFFAAELPELWNREAWPELSDHLEAVSLDANNCFDLRAGDADEMGDILALITGNSPLTSNQITVLPRENYVRLNERVNVLGSVTGGLYVDWQTPCPDLLDDAAIIAAVTVDTPSATTIALALPLYELPARFKLPLAARGAALLIADEDPPKASTLRALAEAELLRQTARITRPWWRR